MQCRHFATEARNLIRMAHQGSGQKRDFTCCGHLGARKPLPRPPQAKVASVRSTPFSCPLQEMSWLDHRLDASSSCPCLSTQVSEQLGFVWCVGSRQMAVLSESGVHI